MYWKLLELHFGNFLLLRNHYFLAMQLGSCGSNLTDEELETHTISAWKEGKMQMTVNGNNRRVNQRNLIHVSFYLF